MTEEKLQGTGIFLVDARVKPGNRILVFIDGDEGVTVSDCSNVSKHIEKQLDRDQEDFELNVSSPGVDHPLTMKRQYVRNIGRKLNVLLSDGNKIRGELLEVRHDGISIRSEKPKGGKKEKNKGPEESREREIPFEDIKEAKVNVSFKQQ